MKNWINELAILQAIVILVASAIIYDPGDKINLGQGKGAFIVTDMLVNNIPRNGTTYAVRLWHISVDGGPMEWGEVAVTWEEWRTLNIGCGFGGDILYPK